jgi:hypothetical protein
MSQPSCCDISPTGRVVSVLWEAGGPAGSKWSPARPEARKGGRDKRGEREAVGKTAGDECVFIPGGLADEVGADAMPDAAGGEGGHGTASTDRVIHRVQGDEGTLEASEYPSFGHCQNRSGWYVGFPLAEL